MASDSVLKARIKRLETKLKTINHEWEMRNSLLQDLREEFLYENDQTTKIKLNRQIQEREAKLKEIESDIEEIENEIEKNESKLNQNQPTLEKINQFARTNQQTAIVFEEDKLRKLKLEFSLLHMDFLKQVDVFQEFINSNGKVYAFLIQGSINYGHIWLLKRLLEDVSHQGVIPPIEYDLKSSICPSDIDRLWRILADKVNLPPKASHEAIARAVSERLKNQNLILVLRDIDYMGEAYLHDFIQEFWQPLVNGIKIDNNSTNNFQLFMFLIDFKGEVSKWNIDLAQRIDQNWQPHILIQLPIEPLEKKIINLWIKSYSGSVMPSDVTKQLDLDQLILEKTKGVPGMVLKEIYELCEYDWYEEEQKWQKL